MNNKITKMRIPVELAQLQKSEATHGITCVAAAEDDYTQLIAKIPGPKGSPYEDAIYELSITFGTHYPFNPPTFKFITPVYHPNIDLVGNICLDLLRMPPAGSYNPAINIESILLSIQLLLSTPNPDDPLNGEAADLFKNNITEFNKKVREFVQKQSSAEKTKKERPKANKNENEEDADDVAPKRRNVLKL